VKEKILWWCQHWRWDVINLWWIIRDKYDLEKVLNEIQLARQLLQVDDGSGLVQLTDPVPADVVGAKEALADAEKMLRALMGYGDNLLCEHGRGLTAYCEPCGRTTTNG